jgi:hypothetical protein
MTLINKITIPHFKSTKIINQNLNYNKMNYTMMKSDSNQESLT